MRIWIQSALLLALIAPRAACVDRSLPWDRVTFEVPSETVRAVVTIEGSDALTMLTLKLGTDTLHVPIDELGDIGSPELHSAQLLFGEGYYGPVEDNEEPISHFLVELEYGKRSKFGNRPSVRFLFHSGAYQERIVLRPTSANTWTEFRKAPGEDAVEAGTITRPPAAPTSGPIEGAAAGDPQSGE